MSPDELRREANRLRLVADLNGARGWESNAESCRRGADALDRLADVIEWAASVPQVEKYPTFTAGWEEAALTIDYITDRDGGLVQDPTMSANQALHRAAARIRQQEQS